VLTLHHGHVVINILRRYTSQTILSSIWDVQGESLCPIIKVDIVKQ
jgi:hypothetical protein